MTPLWRAVTTLWDRSLTWTDGETTAQDIVIAIVDDADVESDETFTVAMLSAPSGAH